MTTEEKAKAYDEVVNKIKPLYEQAKRDGNPIWSTYEYLIPKLAENKEEKIRKELINWINGKTTYEWSYEWCENKDRWIAYLEKRKEPTTEELYAEAGTTEKEYIANTMKMVRAMREKKKEQKPDSLIYDKDLDKAAREYYLSGGADSPFDSTGLVPIVRMAEFGATWMKERMEKEQRPCWNPTEEDVALFNKAITTNASLSPQERAKLDILRMKFKHRPVIEQKEQKPVDYEAELKKCKDNPLYFYDKYVTVKLKPAKWSEEDTDILNCCISSIEEAKENRYAYKETDGDTSYDREIAWLKSIHPPFKDREMKLKILKYLSTRCSSLEFEEVEDYLNNLRPSWKPNEEQMKALKNSAYGTYQNGDGPVLRGLYEQLLKLGVK